MSLSVPSSADRPTTDRPPDDLERAVDTLAMSDDKKWWMKGRWLGQVRWFDAKAETANRWHYVFRIIAIGGGVLIPPLVSVNPGPNADELLNWAHPTAFVLSVLVASAVALDELFHWGERWRHYRRTAELLKMEGWLFIEGGGRYREHQHRANFHDRFFPIFATKVEDLVRHDVEVYLTRIVQDQEDRDRDQQEIKTYLQAEGTSPQEDDGAEQGSTTEPG
jgi:hypothetical protein